MSKFIPPEYGAAAFHCPRCGVYAEQTWQKGLWPYQAASTFELPSTGKGRSRVIDQEEDCFSASLCSHCIEASMWYRSKLVYPLSSTAPLPVSAMPKDVLEDFNEAREVFAISPRSSAALLRLSLQKLCKHLGQTGLNLNADIGALVDRGLPDAVQKALDAVRVVGNNAVHPLELDLRKEPEMAQVLFEMINFIVEEMISRPKRINEAYERLPAGAREAIRKRDAKAT